ncbi:MAG: amino-acid N-acetyltransferase [Gammaproteobacteria bacterium]
MKQNSRDPERATFVRWLREASPYMRAHRGHTFVVSLDGGLPSDPSFPDLIRDLSLLCGIGVKLVIVYGTRPQVTERLRAAGIETPWVGHLRVTDSAALTQVKEATAAVRYELEAQFAHATRIRPLGASPLRIVSGNYVMARPAGVIAGVDLKFTGEIRRIDGPAITSQLETADVALISPLGYSPTGELFSLNALDLACAVATEIKASKWLVLKSGPGIVDNEGALVRQLTPREGRELLRATPDHAHTLGNALRACQFGVERVHIVDASDGALLLELFTRDGSGTLISNAPFDQLRIATIEDVGGILTLLEPLEREGILVKRSREKLETEIDRFMVLVRDGAAVACGALYPFASNAAGEIAGLAVDPDYRRHGFGSALLKALEERAGALDLARVFVLTTQAAHWFLDRGYSKTGLDALPDQRQALYNYQRNSQVLTRRLRG